MSEYYEPLPSSGPRDCLILKLQKIAVGHAVFHGLVTTTRRTESRSEHFPCGKAFENENPWKQVKAFGQLAEYLMVLTRTGTALSTQC